MRDYGVSIYWGFNYIKSTYGGRTDVPDYSMPSNDAFHSSPGDVRPEYIGWRP